VILNQVNAATVLHDPVITNESTDPVIANESKALNRLYAVVCPDSFVGLVPSCGSINIVTMFFYACVY
jgi:hypothetical protein